MMDAAAAFRLSKTQTHGSGRSTVSASMNVLECCHMQDKKGDCWTDYHFRLLRTDARSVHFW